MTNFLFKKNCCFFPCLLHCLLAVYQTQTMLGSVLGPILLGLLLCGTTTTSMPSLPGQGYLRIACKITDLNTNKEVRMGSGRNSCARNSNCTVGPLVINQEGDFQYWEVMFCDKMDRNGNLEVVYIYRLSLMPLYFTIQSFKIMIHIPFPGGVVL